MLEAGTYTSVQDYPGRAGYWDIGVPPSGPMDDYAFRLANRIVGNAPDAAGIEATLAGPTLRFHGDAVIALTGAQCAATLDGAPVPMWRPVAVRAGQVLATGRALSGCRMYLAVRATAWTCPSTWAAARPSRWDVGGHAGRTLRVGDMLPRVRPELPGAPAAPEAEPQAAPPELVPAYGDTWRIGVLYGPHGAPDFFKPEAIDAFFAADWEVHYNSNRLGVRLTGPKPDWARERRRGRAASVQHPRLRIRHRQHQLHRRQPVILTRDGPSLGGFARSRSPRPSCGRWGRSAGDRIRFVRMDYEQAVALAAQDHSLRELSCAAMAAAPSPGAPPAPSRWARERRPGRAASVQHPRLRIRHRQHQLHRRQPVILTRDGPSRAACLPGHDRQGRAVEGGAGQAG